MDARQQFHLYASIRILTLCDGTMSFAIFFELKLTDARFVNFVDFDWAR